MKTTASKTAAVGFSILAFGALLPTVLAQSTVPPNGPGTALGFDGVDDYLYAAPTTLPAGNSHYTIEAWINPVFMSVGAIAAWGNFGVNNRVNAFALTASGLSNYWWGNDLSVTTTNLSAAWHHVAATYDGIARRILVDGVVVGSDFPQGHNAGSGTFSIGAANGGQFFSGGIDEVRIWNIGRSAAEIQANMRRQMFGNELGLVAYWRFDEGGGAQAFDATGNANNTASLLNPGWAASPITPFAPTVTTAAANPVTYANATLNGTANPNTASTTAHFQWGTTSNYGNTTPTNSGLGAGAAPVNFSEVIAGLAPGTTYHFRAVAVNNHGTSYGRDVTFTTESVVDPHLIPPPNGPGEALSFNGAAGENLEATPSTLPTGNSGYTIEAWIKTTAMNVGTVVAWGNFGTTNEVNALRLTPTGLVNYWWGNDLVVTTPNLAGAWHHVAATFDGLTRRIFVDGQFVGRDNPTGHNAGGGNFHIGAAGGFFTADFFSGEMDEVRIWNTGRSGVEIQADMRRQLFGNEFGLVAYWRFDEGAGLSAFDATGNTSNTARRVGNLPWVASTISPFAPPVSTLAPTFGFGLSANVTGQVDGRTSTGPFEAKFEWGDTTALGNVRVSLNVAANSPPQNYAALLSHLNGGQIYYYRAVATNSYGTSYGRTFAFRVPVPNIQTVSNKNDDGPGSLRQAIQDADPGDKIVFAPDVTGTISMTHGEMVIDKELEIVGPGPAALALSGNNLSRVFKVIGAFAFVKISGLTIRDGRSEDGAPGTLSSISGDGAPGGGLYNSGELRLTDCVFTNNRTGKGGSGADGTGNSASGGAGGAGGDGGAIFNARDLILINCSFMANSTGVGGSGGRGAERSPNFTSLKGGNGGAGGKGGDGGAVSNTAILSIFGCTVAHNQCGGGGNGGNGGSGEDGKASHDGGMGGDSGSAGNGGEGGGIRGGGHALNCTFTENRSGRGGNGGVPGYGDNLIGHGLGGDGGDGGNGAAWYSAGSSASAYSCTISRNTCGEGGDAGAFTERLNGGKGGNGGGIADGGVIYNSILAENLEGSGGIGNQLGSPGEQGKGPDVFGAFTSAGHNIVGDSAGSTGFTTGVKNDLAGNLFFRIDIKLGPLADNGGPTLTMTLHPGSPAINAGDDVINGTDQRGYPRKLGSHVDIGAVEVSNFQIIDIRLNGPNVDISFTTEGPFSYQLESKDSLASDPWTLVPGSLRTGTGTMLTVPIPRPSGPITRLYRAVMTP